MTSVQLQCRRFRPVTFFATTLNGKILARVDLFGNKGVGVKIDSLWGLLSAVSQLSSAHARGSKDSKGSGSGQRSAPASSDDTTAAQPPPRYLELQVHNLTMFARLGARVVFAALCKEVEEEGEEGEDEEEEEAEKGEEEEAEKKEAEQAQEADKAGEAQGPPTPPLTLLSIRVLLDWSTLTLLRTHAALVDRLIAEQNELRDNFRGYTASDVAAGGGEQDSVSSALITTSSSAINSYCTASIKPRWESALASIEGTSFARICNAFKEQEAQVGPSFHFDSLGCFVLPSSSSTHLHRLPCPHRSAPSSLTPSAGPSSAGFTQTHPTRSRLPPPHSDSLSPASPLRGGKSRARAYLG